jgi:iron complex outermembrane receptor protein
MKNTYLTLGLLLLFSINIYAQSASVQGVVSDADNGEPLIGATVVIQGTATGASTDASGRYSFTAPAGSHTLIVSFIGYETVNLAVDLSDGSNTYNFKLNAGDVSLSEIVVVGSRNQNRTVTETAVPVDVISIDEITQGAPQIEITQILNYLAPSFSSNKQTISDGTDHVDPASLRGLGVDHVLVLINGKRRHSSSLVNVNGTVGRGSVGTDLNTIPAAAIDRIEILRDGAAAQYGSDAIAGVINIVLKSSTDKVTLSVTGGQMYQGDGEKFQLNANYGFKIGQDGFINLTGQYQYRGRTDRSGEYTGSIFKTNGTGVFREDFALGDFNPYLPGARLTAQEATDLNAANTITNNLTDAEEEAMINANGGRRAFSLKAGDSQVENAAFMVNSVIPLAGSAEFYVFGGINSRRGLATGFYRLPNQSRNLLTINPNGFLPEINSRIFDGSISAGIRGEIGGWNVDFSNTYGTNSFQFIISNTLNASRGTPSPNTFNAGGFGFGQNTTNLDFSKFYDGSMSGINLAFGAEYRVETYQLFAGEEGSYRDYGTVPLVDNDGTNDFLNPSSTTNIMYGRPGGSQVFPGFRPSNELRQSRTATGLYGDVEFNFTDNFFVDVAARYENFSDFGSTLNGKVAMRLAVSDAIAIRAAGSTGFRAPSLHQRYFNNTSTIFTTLNGVTVPNEVGTFRNDSRLANLLGIPSLTNENATNFSGGLTWEILSGLNLTVDGYYVKVDNRVILTGQFKPTGDPNNEIDKILAAQGAGRAQFFSNSIDTKTTGVDFILSYTTEVGNGTLRSTLASNFTTTTVDNVNYPQLIIDNGLEDSYFNLEEQSRFETATPKSKINLNFLYQVSKFTANLNLVHFGEVTAVTSDGTSQTFSAKLITDLSLGYDIADNLNFTIGANNLLNVYPDENIDAFRSSERFVYSRRVSQFGANGGYYFGRLTFRF